MLPRRKKIKESETRPRRVEPFLHFRCVARSEDAEFFALVLAAKGSQRKMLEEAG